MLLIGATGAEDAFFSAHTGIDWNVLFLLLGMMLIVSVLKRTGVFEFVAIWAAKRSRGRPYRLMVLSSSPPPSCRRGWTTSPPSSSSPRSRSRSAAGSASPSCRI